MIYAETAVAKELIKNIASVRIRVRKDRSGVVLFLSVRIYYCAMSLSSFIPQLATATSKRVREEGRTRGKDSA
jgi:hypothetical protein